MILPIVSLPVDPKETIHLTSPAQPLRLSPSTRLYVVDGDTAFAVVSAVWMTIFAGEFRDVLGVSYNEDQRRELWDFVKRLADIDSKGAFFEDARKLIAKYDGLPF